MRLGVSLVAGLYLSLLFVWVFGALVGFVCELVDQVHQLGHGEVVDAGYQRFYHVRRAGLLTFGILHLLQEGGHIETLGLHFLADVLTLGLALLLILDQPGLLGVGHLQLALLVGDVLMLDVVFGFIGEGGPQHIDESLLHGA